MFRKPVYRLLSIDRYAAVFTFLLIVLWSYASVSKLFTLERSRAALEPIFGSGLASLVSQAVPVAELITVGLLVFRPARRAGWWCSFTLLAVFTGYIVLVLGDAFHHTPCTCGGVLEILSWKEHLVFNIAVIVLHFPVLLRREGNAERQFWLINGKEVPRQ